MRTIDSIARPLVAAPFVMTGLEALRDPGPRAERVAPLVKPLADRASWLPSKDPEMFVRAEGALSLGAGVLLALGKAQRLTVLLLAAQLVPAVLTEHRFWAVSDPQRRVEDRGQMLKNVSLLGALLMVGTEPRHRPHRPGRAARRKARAAAAPRARAVRAEAARKVGKARGKAVRLTKR